MVICESSKQNFIVAYGLPSEQAGSEVSAIWSTKFQL